MESTLRAACGACPGVTGVAIGAVPTARDRRKDPDVASMKYVGHFNIDDGRRAAIRWAYTDGLVFDEETRLPDDHPSEQ